MTTPSALSPSASPSAPRESESLEGASFRPSASMLERGGLSSLRGPSLTLAAVAAGFATMLGGCRTNRPQVHVLDYRDPNGQTVDPMTGRAGNPISEVHTAARYAASALVLIDDILRERGGSLPPAVENELNAQRLLLTAQALRTYTAETQLQFFVDGNKPIPTALAKQGEVLGQLGAMTRRFTRELLQMYRPGGTDSTKALEELDAAKPAELQLTPTPISQEDAPRLLEEALFRAKLFERVLLGHLSQVPAESRPSVQMQVEMAAARSKLIESDYQLFQLAPNLVAADQVYGDRAIGQSLRPLTAILLLESDAALQKMLVELSPEGAKQLQGRNDARAFERWKGTVTEYLPEGARARFQGLPIADQIWLFWQHGEVSTNAYKGSRTPTQEGNPSSEVKAALESEYRKVAVKIEKPAESGASEGPVKQPGR